MGNIEREGFHAKSVKCKQTVLFFREHFSLYYCNIYGCTTT